MNRIRRPACTVSIVVATALTLAASAQAQETPACELGRQLRQALGFGPHVMAVLEVDAQTHAAIVAEAEDYCAVNRERVEPALAAWDQARRDAYRQYELNGNVATADQTLLAAVAALRVCCSDAIADMGGYLTVDQADLLANLAANELLDPDLALLDLTAQQRSHLAAAQQARDLVLKHHKDRKNPSAVSDAWIDFEDVVYATLTVEQQAEYEDLADARGANLADTLATEESACARGDGG